MKKTTLLLTLTFCIVSLFSQNNEFGFEVFKEDNIREKKLTGIYLGTNFRYAYSNTTYNWDGLIKLNLVYKNNYAIGWALQYQGQEPLYINQYNTRMMLSALTTGLTYDRYIFDFRRFSFVIPAYISFGAAMLEQYDYDYNYYYYSQVIWEEQFLATAEIGFQLDIKLGKYSRIGIVAAYRITNPIRFTNKSPWELYGFRTGVELKWGKFN